MLKIHFEGFKDIKYIGEHRKLDDKQVIWRLLGRKACPHLTLLSFEVFMEESNFPTLRGRRAAACRRVVVKLMTRLVDDRNAERAQASSAAVPFWRAEDEDKGNHMPRQCRI